MDLDGYRRDMRDKPDRLRLLATALEDDDPWRATPIEATSRIVLIGMGSSHYANAVAAARLRAHGVDAVATLASSDLLPRADDRTVVIAVSAGGGSMETRHAAAQYDGRAPLVALTNTPGSPITVNATAVIDMDAGPEVGEVACRSFAHTLALLLALEASIVGGPAVPATVRRAADAAEDLLATQDAWLPRMTELLIGPQGSHLVAPARRLSSAQQGALMLRETPRLPAVACETGDWSHVDVYLTKTTDYRMLLFPGSRWDPELLRWVRERGSTLVSVGADVPDAAMTVRYVHDDVDDVRLLAEVGVPELIAAGLGAA